MIFRVSLLLASLSAAAAQSVPLTSVRSFTGSENALAAGLDAELIRLAGPAHYPDGQGIDLSMFTEPNARGISNIVAAQPSGIARSTASDLLWQWGQFMDHDVGLTEGHDEPFTITSPDCNNGDIICNISMQRALHHFTGGVREQLNEITAFIDASMVYGHTDERASFLRDSTGGRMRQGPNELLPLDNGSGLANALPGGLGFDENALFIGGDIRVNEQIGLLAMHTLWVREHNRIADILSANFPSSSHEDIFQMARKLVTAEIQAITYKEFLPTMIGDFAPDISAYGGFRSTVNPGMAQEFSTVAFRVGHTFLSENLMFHNGAAQTGSISLIDAFFDPGMATASPNLIDEILIGQAVQNANSADIFVIDEVRSFLFGAPVAGEGRDLVAFNIARGRDNGCVKYNDMRAGYGLPRVQNFNQVSSDNTVRQRLSAAYGNDVDLCDPWICGLAEDTAGNGQLGELFSTILADQFQRLMDGDSFFYLGDNDVRAASIIAAGINVDTVTLADVINNNTPTKAAPINHPAMVAASNGGTAGASSGGFGGNGNGNRNGANN